MKCCFGRQRLICLHTETTPNKLNILYSRHSATQPFLWWSSDQAALCKMLTPFHFHDSSAHSQYGMFFFMPILQSMLIRGRKKIYCKSDDSTSYLVSHLVTWQPLFSSYRFSTKLQCIYLYNSQCIYCLELMSWSVRLREPLYVTILNKIEIKH